MKSKRQLWSMVFVFEFPTLEIIVTLVGKQNCEIVTLKLYFLELACGWINWLTPDL